MLPRLLLDTHVLIRWFFESRRLSRRQLDVVEGAIAKGEPIALAAATILETAILASGSRLLLKTSLQDFFRDLSSNPAFRVIPLSFEIALDTAALGILRDPADRVIVATARIHRLQLVTSDERIVDSGLVSTIE